MTDLPPGWEWATLGEIGDYINGRAFKESDWSAEGRPIVRIQNLTGTGKEFHHFSGVLDDGHIARAGDLLISWAATLGSYIWRGPEAAVNQHIFKAQSKINIKFHHYLVDHLVSQLYLRSQGSGIVHVTRGKFESLEFRLPPLAEQWRIVAALEGHFSRLDSGTTSLSGSTRRLQKLRDQVIAAGCAGSLCVVEGPHAPPPPDVGLQDGLLPCIPQSWRWARLHELADVVGGLTKDSKKQADHFLEEVPYLRVANVQRGRIDLSTVTTIRASKGKVEQLSLRLGDVLLNEGGDRDKLARGWVWEGQLPLCIHQNHVFRARVKDGVLDPKILAWHANSFGKIWAEANGKQSVNLASISLSKIRLLPVPIPPKEEQPRIVLLIEEHLDALDRLMISVVKAENRATQLRRALLADAFAGRLVPQDPGDEPASVLLERIRAERAAQPKSKRTRRTKQADITQEALL